MVSHYLQASDTFEVEWDDPATADRRWNLDREHNHGVLKRFEIEQSVVRGAIGMNVESVVVSGRIYAGPPTLPAPPKELRRHHYAELWDNTYRAESIAATEVVLGRDHAALSDEALAQALAEDLERGGIGFKATQSPLVKIFVQMHPFSRFCRAEFGDPAGLLIQYRMLQGRATETTEAALRLERMAEQVEADPDLLAALESGGVEAAQSDTAHAEFFSTLDGYIARYGWRATIWSDLTTPTWAEDPAVPLAMIVRYVHSPELRPSIALAAAAADRETAITEAMDQLADAEKQQQLRAFLEDHASLPRVREDRAHWQLVLNGMLRRPLMELGRRFVARDLLDAPEDVLHLVTDEIQALARGAIDGRSLVAKHRATYEHWKTLDAPDFVGSGDAGADPLAGLMQPDVAERVSADGKLHAGVPASAGVAYGRARVVTELADAMMIEPGEILVCRTTAPPWTPVFALASAVVTEGGTVLAHTAIVAREYKIPAVLGINRATSLIPDGAMITVDGNHGTVLLD